jgi:hypothetical protein
MRCAIGAQLVEATGASRCGGLSLFVATALCCMSLLLQLTLLRCVYLFDLYHLFGVLCSPPSSCRCTSTP